MDAVVQFFQSIPWDQIVIQTMNGIVTGMILALVASGLTLIFGIMDVVNFAHGELFMLGAYIGVIVLGATGSFWLALILASLIVAILGGAMQIVTLRPLIGRDPLTTILATFGISLILQNYALWQFGPSSRKINEPITAHFNLFYLEYPWYRLVIAALSARDHRQLLPVPQTREIRRLDSRHHAGPRHGAGHGHPGAVGTDRRLRHRRGDGGGERRAVRAAGRRQSHHGPRLGAQGLHRRRGRRHGQSRRLDAAAIFISLLESYASIWVNPSQAVIVSFVVLILTLLFRPTGLFVPTPK